MGRRTDIEIVGVVKNTSVAGLRRTPPLVVYVPFAQFEGGLEPSLAIRAAGPTGQAAAAIRDAPSAAAPHPRQVRSSAVGAGLEHDRAGSDDGDARRARFGLLALALASIGLYGLLAFQRRAALAARSASAWRWLAALTSDRDGARRRRPPGSGRHRARAPCGVVRVSLRRVDAVRVDRQPIRSPPAARSARCCFCLRRAYCPHGGRRRWTQWPSLKRGLRPVRSEMRLRSWPAS